MMPSMTSLKRLYVQEIHTARVTNKAAEEDMASQMPVILHRVGGAKRGAKRNRREASCGYLRSRSIALISMQCDASSEPNFLLLKQFRYRAVGTSSILAKHLHASDVVGWRRRVDHTVSLVSAFLHLSFECA